MWRSPSWAASWRSRDAITVGDIQAFIQYVRSFTQPITQIANISNVLQQTAAAAERVFEFLDEDEEVAETADPVQPGKGRGPGRLPERAIWLRPGQDRHPRLLAPMSQPGQKIAIVGPTGAGKTTMVKLLMRFYDVDERRDPGGRSRHPRFQPRGPAQHVWHGAAGYLALQRHASWRISVTAGPSASDEEVIAAAKAAHVDHFVRTLPEGYDMVLNEEAIEYLPGAEAAADHRPRRRWPIPRMLILDEATSSVDTRTEVLIQKAMDNLMEGRTSFIIAHRLSTIRNADLILVMNEGDIVEQGKHEELLATRRLLRRAVQQPV